IAFLKEDAALCATILGASGVGKSTAAKQALLHLQDAGYYCWEHEWEHTLDPGGWLAVAGKLKEQKDVGILIVDDAHQHLQELNDLIDGLATRDNPHLKVIAVSTRNHWYPRIKTPNLFRYGKTFLMSMLSDAEIEKLLDL